MRLHSISITNLAAFPTFTATFPAVAVIQGRNGLGKSSLQSVIRYAFGRRADGSRAVEHDPRMVHGNADKGEATITFDDGSLLKVSVTRKDTTRQTKPKEGNKWSRSTADIDALANALSYDPVQFKDFDEKRRVETILRVMPAQVTAEEISTAVGDVAIAFPHDPGLAAINAYYDDIYAMRREENVAADRLRKHAEELEAAPGVVDDGVDWNNAAREKRVEHGNLVTSESDYKASIRLTFNQFVDEQKAAHAKTVQDSLDAMNKEIERARGLANQAVTDKRTELSPAMDRLTAEIATAEEKAKTQAKAEGAKQAAERARAGVETHKAASEKMTAALDRLTELKNVVAARLPIKGITITAPLDGMPVDICRIENDALVPFSKWNETSKLLFCLRIAVLTHGQCGLVCIDSIDAVDPETRKALIKTMEKYASLEKMQFLLGEADGGELRVSELEG